MRFFFIVIFFNFGHIGGVQSARGAGSIQEKYSILKCSDGRGIEEGKAVRRRCCRASNDRCVSACVCACMCFSGGGRGVMLIKVAHLQPIKELLSFIKANLLKHAVQDAATSRPCHTRRLALTPLLCVVCSCLTGGWYLAK